MRVPRKRSAPRSNPRPSHRTSDQRGARRAPRFVWVGPGGRRISFGWGPAGAAFRLGGPRTAARRRLGPVAPRAAESGGERRRAGQTAGGRLPARRSSRPAAAAPDVQADRRRREAPARWGGQALPAARCALFPGGPGAGSNVGLAHLVRGGTPSGPVPCHPVDADRLLLRRPGCGIVGMRRPVGVVADRRRRCAGRPCPAAICSMVMQSSTGQTLTQRLQATHSSSMTSKTRPSRHRDRLVAGVLAGGIAAAALDAQILVDLRLGHVVEVQILPVGDVGHRPADEVGDASHGPSRPSIAPSPEIISCTTLKP